ncbi:sirohydrochlorin cobaltochelatase [Parafannyhessea umbonata]|uniref:sirohydrochlorin cobaltochelatase n=1 Tax=Parafannyhessea umbonata TaxID=604330 RepID=UPI00359C1C44
MTLDAKHDSVAASDDPLNADGIGPREVLVVSHGTVDGAIRARDIGAIEREVQTAYPGWSVRRAFTSQPIINRIRAREGQEVDDVGQALQRAADNGVESLVMLPTLLVRGSEYEKLAKAADECRGRMSINIAGLLLNGGESDLRAVAEAVASDAARDAGYDGVAAAREDGCAIVLVGHGSTCEAGSTYSQMQAQLRDLGHGNVFVGTIEGEPADTSCEAVTRGIANEGLAKAQLRPLMIVAGAHACRDMAGGAPDSWKSRLEAAGIATSAQLKGLGEVAAVRRLFVRRVAEAMPANVGEKDL